MRNASARLRAGCRRCRRNERGHRAGRGIRSARQIHRAQRVCMNEDVRPARGVFDETESTSGKPRFQSSGGHYVFPSGCARGAERRDRRRRRWPSFARDYALKTMPADVLGPITRPPDAKVYLRTEPVIPAAATCEAATFSTIQHNPKDSRRV